MDTPGDPLLHMNGSYMHKTTQHWPRARCNSLAIISQDGTVIADSIRLTTSLA